MIVHGNLRVRPDIVCGVNLIQTSFHRSKGVAEIALYLTSGQRIDVEVLEEDSDALYEDWAGQAYLLD